MRQALSVALQEFSGAVVLVSHDRHLLNTVADELIVVHEGRAVRFDGDLDDYAHWLAAGGPVRVVNSGAAAEPARAVAAAPAATDSAEQRRQRRRVRGGAPQSPRAFEGAACSSRSKGSRSSRASAPNSSAHSPHPSCTCPPRAQQLRTLLERQKELEQQSAEAEAAWLEASGAPRGRGGAVRAVSSRRGYGRFSGGLSIAEPRGLRGARPGADRRGYPGRDPLRRRGMDPGRRIPPTRCGRWRICTSTDWKTCPRPPPPPAPRAARPRLGGRADVRRGAAGRGAGDLQRPVASRCLRDRRTGRRRACRAGSGGGCGRRSRSTSAPSICSPIWAAGSGSAFWPRASWGPAPPGS